MATIKEVAAAVGVSLGTASNVINGKINNIELIEKVEVVHNLTFNLKGFAVFLQRNLCTFLGLKLKGVYKDRERCCMDKRNILLSEMGNFNITLGYMIENLL